ncbi:MAG: serine hydrolase domain-containing protein [Bacteroidota bacterium]
MIYKIFLSLYCLLHLSCLSFGQNGQSAISLIDYLEDYIEHKNIPGLSVSIVSSDSIYFVGGIGYANIEKKESVTGEHLFRMGSVSKSFTALGVLKILEDSPFELNSAIKEIDQNIPFRNDWEDESPVLVSHLLEHTSGFEDFHAHAVYNRKDSLMPPITNMVYDHRQSLHSRWTPGTKKAYANPNYIVAGHIIEVLSETSFDTYIRDNVLLPLDMTSSGYFFKKTDDAYFAQGYQRIGKTLQALSFATINGSPAGDFCANAIDMANYLQFMLQRDTLLFDISMFDRIELPKTNIASEKGLETGYGLGNYTIWKNGFLFHGHGGQIDGFASRYIYSREADLGISISMNRNGDANALVDEILDFMLGNESQANYERKIVPIPDSLKNKFCGFYELDSPKNELFAFSDQLFGGFSLDFQMDKIVRRRLLGRPKDTLYYAGNNQFYFEDETIPAAILIETEKGESAFWINENYAAKKSRWKRLLIFFGLVISFLLVSAFFVYGVWWLIRNLFRKKKINPLNHIVLVGVGCSFIAMFVGFGLTMSNLETAMHMNASSLLYYLSSYILILMCMLAIFRSFKITGSGRFKKFYITTTIGAIFLSYYLMDIGFIGLKLWNY